GDGFQLRLQHGPLFLGGTELVAHPFHHTLLHLGGIKVAALAALGTLATLAAFGTFAALSALRTLAALTALGALSALLGRGNTGQAGQQTCSKSVSSKLSHNTILPGHSARYKWVQDLNLLQLFRI